MPCLLLAENSVGCHWCFTWDLVPWNVFLGNYDESSKKTTGFLVATADCDDPYNVEVFSGRVYPIDLTKKYLIRLRVWECPDDQTDCAGVAGSTSPIIEIRRVVDQL